MPDRVICIVQARVGSSRLPGKSLLKLAGRPLLAHVLERAAAIGGLDGIVLATSDQARDDVLAAEAAARGVQVVRGSETDVLYRVQTAAALARADVIVRVTGDCPLLAPEVGAEVLELWRRHVWPPDRYAWNDTSRSGWPDGTDVEVFSRGLLEEAAARARRQSDREHVTSYIREAHPEAVHILSTAHDLGWLKLSVDRMADYERVAAIFGHLAPREWALPDTLRACEAAGLLPP